MPVENNLVSHFKILNIDIYEELGEVTESAWTAEGFEEAYLGIGWQFGSEPMAVYDYDTCLEVLQQRDGMTSEEAQEFFEFNVLGAGMGGGTMPVFVQRRGLGLCPICGTSPCEYTCPSSNGDRKMPCGCYKVCQCPERKNK